MKKTVAAKKTAGLLCAACLIFTGCKSTSAPPPEQAHVHIVQSVTKEATCEEAGKLFSYCTECGERWEETVSPPLGHLYAETSESPSRLKKCMRPGCYSGVMPQSERIYDESVTYTFDAEKRAEIDGYYEAVEAYLEEAGPYVQGSAGGSPSSFREMVVNFNAYSQSFGYLNEQNRYAELRYYEHDGSEKTRNDFAEISAYYTQVTSNYYVMFCDICDSAYRDAFTDVLVQSGWSQELIAAYLHWGEIYRSQEYAALRNRNTEILLEYRTITDFADPSIPVLYGEYVSNYNRLAVLTGYENYPAYAYGNVYRREYGYREAEGAAGYIKQYLSPVYAAVNGAYTEYMTSREWTQAETDEYAGMLTASFFENTVANGAVNDYFEKVVTKDANKEISFAEEFRLLMKNGNYFLADSERAFTAFVPSLNVSFLSLGPGYYRTAFTLVHEFGHYFQYAYNGGVTVSYDLMETHSQGNEALFLAYLKDSLSERAYRGVLLYRLRTALNTVISAMAVNTFETAVYTNEYTGTDSGKFLADGKITPDEYDGLYTCILSDLGVGESSDYWRRVVFQNPCYYVSYSLSQVCSLQLLAEACDSFESALNKYLKLFTYTDSASLTGYGSVLEYAGLYGYDDEALYREVSSYISSVIG